MAIQWLRLWHDMPTDPKWRTIARASGQRIGDVTAVYLHLLVCASNATERGQTQSFSCEDVASALDIEPEQVADIFAAMQGRVMDGSTVKGWEKRQVSREDGSAERSKARRDAQKTTSTATDRNRPQPTATELIQPLDKEKEEIREEKKEKRERAPTEKTVALRFSEFWEVWPASKRKGAKPACLKVWEKNGLDCQADEIFVHVKASADEEDWKKENGRYIPAPLAYLNQQRWAGAEVEDRASKWVGCL